MLKTKTPKTFLVIMAIAILFAIGCHFTQQTLPTDATSSCNTTITAAEFDSWFVSGSASLNGVVNPANSVTFPDIPNCSFYKWTEQMFLWLMSPAPASYGGNSIVLNSNIFYDVSPPDGDGNRTFVPHNNGSFKVFNIRVAQKGVLGLPVVMEKRTLRLLEILPEVKAPSGNHLVLNANNQEVEVANVQIDEKNKRVQLFDISGKVIERPRAILVSQRDTGNKLFRDRLQMFGDNFDKSELVQRLKFKDKSIFFDLAGNVIEVEQGQADGGVLIAQNGSLVYYATTVNEVFAYFRTQQGATFPSPSPVSFPTTQSALDNICAFARANGKKQVIDSQALAIEVKSSWVEADGLADLDKFITITAKVPTYDKSNPNLWVPNGEKTVKLAMVGIHVVGSTKGHPELLWGSFEHASADPAEAYDYTSTSGTKTIPRNTSGNWVFCANGSAGPFNEMHASMNGSNIEAVAPFSIGPSNILKTHPWGMLPNNAGSNAQLITINNSVRSFLDNADVRRNYLQIGTTWTIGGAAPNAGNQVGTNKLANSTMETFQQGSNCFDCHRSNKTDVSHTFRSVQPLTF